MIYNVTYRKKDKGIQAIISYKDNNGKWRQKSKQGFKTQKEAKPVINKIIADIENGLKKENEILSYDYFESTLEGVFNSFIHHIKLYRSQNTIDNYAIAFNKFYDLHDAKVKDIKKMHIQSCIDELIKQGLKPSSIETYVKRIKQIFIYYKDNYYGSYTIPTDNLKIPKKDAADKKALNIKEVYEMLDDFKKNNFQYYSFILLCVCCGLRRGESLGVTWNDLNKDENIIVINKQWKKLDSNSWGFGETKNKKHRIIPLTNYVSKELEYIKNNTKVIDINNRITKHNGMYISQRVNKYLKKYGITIHELRHTYITNMLASGVHPRTVAELVGDNVEQIYNTYSHVTSDMFKNASITMNKIF